MQFGALHLFRRTPGKTASVRNNPVCRRADHPDFEAALCHGRYLLLIESHLYIINDLHEC